MWRFVVLFNSKIGQSAKKIFANLKSGLAHKVAAVQAARPDHVRFESPSCCFPGELVSQFFYLRVLIHDT